MERNTIDGKIIKLVKGITIITKLCQYIFLLNLRDNSNAIEHISESLTT